MSIQRLALGIFIAAAAVTAAIVLNLVLLGAAGAQNDPIGNLSSKANLPPAPAWTIRPRPASDHQGGGADD